MRPACACSARTACRNLPARAAALAELAGAEWHMIGHLQTNKAGKAAEMFGAVDSVDSVKLAEKLDAAAERWARS